MNASRRRVLERVALALACPGLVLAQPGGEARVTRRVRWTFDIVNPLPRELRDQVLWFYAPAAETAVQELASVQVSMPWGMTRDPLGHAVVEVTVPHLAPHARRVLSVTAEVVLRDAPRARPLDDARAWLRAERFIESDDPDVLTVARSLRRDGAAETARAVYDWVRMNIAYAGYVPDDRGAADALATRRGDCTEYAYLVTALARANGIPARMVGGHDVDRDAVLRAADYHNWAELHFDGVWNLVDAQKGRWLQPAANYLGFRVHHGMPVNPIGLAHRHAVQGEMEVRAA